MASHFGAPMVHTSHQMDPQSSDDNPYNLKKGEVSTGTTIMAIPFDGGVVMGADSRTSTGTYIAVRISDKITQLHDRIWCCRSGSAADTQALSDYVKHYLGQLAIETGRRPTVKIAANLMRKLIYENKDNLMAGVIVGGWDPVEGGSVYNIALGGSCIKMPFAIGGSGSTYIYGLIDAKFKEGMSQDEAEELVKKTISHAMARDGSSGGIIRTVVVTEEKNVRNFIPGNKLPYGP
uniref:Proteasome subunit beta n=1 Tax=Pseudictyota dubia TaxID=2749911 RepID=A0A7R9W1D7_9STRA|mmetsp:Transcript_28241/g.52579  ORF Transcript_28241/g.52579 Transcript_28241/m.52579 type:complete len:235 (+) Transcript_28241:43-747(+)|eukprot:CAMPEP_0197435402 /NCGR_PEP_ID=MMETSP1175-20131217/2997_1 /TAXON_ID=1003142 /ORGANISM="Triceratium dubium, Strain CCMP147" /LENGTH=234 /DNA_ID=CAMNT_0042964435 /DNA_START=43 /DNA_END=747 /DNA_ORIENTATION=+